MIVKLPVVPPQPGCVTVLRVGMAGVAGAVFTVTLVDALDVHKPKVAVTVYVPDGAVIVFPD